MRYVRRLAMGLLVLAAGGQLMQANCAGNIQRELEMLWGSAANLDQIDNSILIKLFGPGVLQFW